MRVALINPHWTFDGSIYFGCREPHLPIEYGVSRQMLEAPGHQVSLIDAHMFGLSLPEIIAELRSFAPDMAVITTAPTYLFWRCAPPELRVPQKLASARMCPAPAMPKVAKFASSADRRRRASSISRRWSGPTR